MNDYKEKEDVRVLDFINKVNDEIIVKIKDYYSTLKFDVSDINKGDEGKTKMFVESFYIRGFDIPFCKSIKYNLDDLDDCMDILYEDNININRLIEKEANAYIKKNKEDIDKALLYFYSFQYYTEHFLVNNSDCTTLRKLNTIFLNKNFKTLKMKYSKNGNELIFNIRNKGIFLRTLSDFIPYRLISTANTKSEFSDTFNTSSGGTCIEPKYISEISYRNNILYKK